MSILLQSNGRFATLEHSGEFWELADLQALVGGDIEVVTALTRSVTAFGPYNAMVINENGKNMGLPVNVLACMCYQHDQIDPIVGNAVLCIMEGEELK